MFQHLDLQHIFPGVKRKTCKIWKEERKILLKIIVVRHFFFDPIRLEAMEQKCGTDIVTLVDVVFEQKLRFVLFVTVTVVALVSLSVGVGGLRLPVLDDGKKPGSWFNWIGTRFILFLNTPFPGASFDWGALLFFQASVHFC